MGDYTSFFQDKKYVTTGELAKMLNTNDSTIRYYCIEFEDFIQPVRSNKKRFFEEEQVERLLYVIYLLKEKHLTVRLVKEHLKTADGKNMNPMDEVAERPLLSMIFQVNEKLDRLTKNQKIGCFIPGQSDKANSPRDEIETQNDKQNQSNSNPDIIRQADFYIFSIKNSIDQYEMAKCNGLLNEMVNALCAVEASADKLKSLAADIKIP